MENPHTPEKQILPSATARLPPTPPHSAAGSDNQNAGYQQDRELTLPIHTRSFKNIITIKVPGAKRKREEPATDKSNDKIQTGQTLSSWLHEPVDENKRRKRMASFFHSLWPSDAGKAPVRLSTLPCFCEIDVS